MTPLRISQWEEALRSHPDSRFRDYILSGISLGFRIGFNRNLELRSCTSNLVEHSDVIDKYIQDELQLHRFIGPFSLESLPLSVHCIPFGVIPKANSNSWRLITDLSSPSGASVNEGISSKYCSLSYILSYISVDTIASQAVKLGRGTMLAKADIKSAYRLVPAHPDDRPLL